MFRRSLLISLVFLGGCTTTQVARETSQTSAKEGSVTVLYQSNRLGDLEPCGCHYNPIGGADREYHAIQKIRQANPAVLFVEAGNSFASLAKNAKSDASLKKAELIKNILNEDGLDVFAPGQQDYLLGLEFLKRMEAESKFKYIGTNVVDAKGLPVFSPYAIVEKGGLKFAIVSATPENADLGDSNLKVLNAEAELAKLIPTLKGKADFIILLSQLGYDADTKLAGHSPDIRLIVGSDRELSAAEPFWFNGGKTVLVDGGNNGNTLGTITLGLHVPVVALYSPEIVKKNQDRIAAWEARMATEPKSKASLEPMVAAVKQFENVAPIEGGSTYQAKLIRLTPEEYAKGDNVITEMVKKYRESVRQRAIGE